MTAHMRDTQFGHLVRFISGNKAFRYPDETDPSLWEKSLRQETNGSKTNVDSSDAKSQEPIDARTSEGSQSSEKYAEIPGTDPPDLSAARSLENGNDILLVDWYGPDDPENPQNWPSYIKHMVTSLICILNFSVYIASSIYVPGEQSIMKDFHSSETVATLGLSLFTLGYGVGPMLWSPMSEMPQLGRNGIYFWTLTAFVLFQLPTGYAVNMPMFLFFRWFTGFLGSPCLATGGATMMDIYTPTKVAYAICIFASFGVMGPVFGPIVGGFAAPVKGWRWTIWIFTWLCVLALLLLFFLLPETSAANILYKRAKRLRKATGDDRLRSQSEIDAAHHTTKDHIIVLARAFTLTFSEPIVFFMDLYTALLYGVLFIWFESFPLVFGDIYHFGAGEQGLAFLGIFVGTLITVPLYLLWVKHGVNPKITTPTFKPEMILPPTFFGSLCLPICLFWYGWSARESVHWIMPIIGSAFFSVGVVTLFNAVLNYLGMCYPAYAASIFAGNALFRASFGGSFPLFARALFNTLGIGPGNSLLGGIAICFIPIPVIFYKYGEKIRNVSKNARHDT